MLTLLTALLPMPIALLDPSTKILQPQTPQAAVSQAWEQRHAAHTAHRTFRAWEQHARHTSRHPSSRTCLRTRLRQNGIQHEGLVYPTNLSRRVLLAWIGILDPAGAWRAQRLLRRCWSQWRLLCRRREEVLRSFVASRAEGGEGTVAALRASGESRLSGRAVCVSGGIQREAALWYDRWVIWKAGQCVLMFRV